MVMQQSSELLRVLEQLDDAAWAETLLPRLRATRSAGAVALACQQLRRLCQRNQRELRLTPGRYQWLHLSDLDAISRPFPACSSVELTAGLDDHLQLAIAVPLLARLPQLQSLRLCIQGMELAHMVLALQFLRLQLPQLCLLQLTFGSKASDSPQAWQVLGAATQLTKLAVMLVVEDDWGHISLQHLSELRPLGSSLQHLELGAEGLEEEFSVVYEDCRFLSSFSALTSLVLPLASEMLGLAAISSCTALQQLHLNQCNDAAPESLDAAECATLAQLTRLTELDISPSSDTPALLAALRCLSGLQVLRLADVSSSHLPVLATLTKLTNLEGHWNDDEPTDQAAVAAAPGAPAATCSSIVWLQMEGDFPPAAFPGAKVVEVQYLCWPSQLVSITQHMPKLEAIRSLAPMDSFNGFVRLDSSAPEAERVAAVRSLRQLACLSHLAFGLNDEEEAAALGTVTQLQHLGLYVLDGSSVTAQGLSSVLCRLSKLHTVVFLFLTGLQVSQSEAKLLLAGMSGVQQLAVKIGGWHFQQQQQQVWQAAAAAARQSGLQLPGQCTFS